MKTHLIFLILFLSWAHIAIAKPIHPIDPEVSENYFERTDREARAKAEIESVMSSYKAATSGTGSDGSAAKSLQHIEEMEKQVAEFEANKAKPVEFFEKMQQSGISDFAAPPTPMSAEFVAIVKERGSEAKDKVNQVQDLLANSIGFFAPESAVEEIVAAQTNTGNTTLPNSLVMPAWFQSVEAHFAKALASHSAEEFKRGLTLMDTIVWQASTHPEGYVLTVYDLPEKDRPPTFFESFIPGVDASYSCNHGSAAECVFDVVTSIPVLKPAGALKNVVKEGGEEIAEESAESAGRTIGRRSRDPEKDYKEIGKERGDKVFDVDKDVWNRMTEAERWAANKKFLDRGIRDGDEFFLASDKVPLRTVHQGNKNSQSGAYSREIDYLLDHGYKFNKDGTKLVPR